MGVMLYQAQRKEAPSQKREINEMVVERNAIYVSEQSPGQSVQVDFATFERPGFVAIHEVKNEKPGVILGVSVLLNAGEAGNIPLVRLLRAVRDGETLFAMLHLDDGDGKFDPTKDKPAESGIGGPIMMEFMVYNGANPPDEVNL